MTRRKPHSLMPQSMKFAQDTYNVYVGHKPRRDNLQANHRYEHKNGYGCTGGIRVVRKRRWHTGTCYSYMSIKYWYVRDKEEVYYYSISTRTFWGSHKQRPNYSSIG